MAGPATGASPTRPTNPASRQKAKTTRRATRRGNRAASAFFPKDWDDWLRAISNPVGWGLEGGIRAGRELAGSGGGGGGGGKDKPRQFPTSSGGGGGGRTTSYGGFGANVSYSGAPDFYGEARGVSDRYLGAANQIEAKYDAALAEVRRLYRFSETPEEKAMLQFILGDLEGQRRAGYQIINKVYGKEIKSTRKRSKRMRKDARREGRSMAELYTDTAGRLDEHLGVVADAGTGHGLGTQGTPMTGDATDYIAALNSLAPVEQAATQQLGNIAAEDVAFLSDTMRAEKGAQQGDLQRMAMQLSAQATIEHQRRVQERIAQERMQFAGQAGDFKMAGVQGWQDMTGRALDLLGNIGLSSAEQQYDNWGAHRDRGWSVQDRGFAAREAERDRAASKTGSGSVAEFRSLAAADQVIAIGNMIREGNTVGARGLLESGALKPRAREALRKQGIKPGVNLTEWQLEQIPE